MTQEDKELLLKDLSARLPYGVMLSVDDVAEKYNNKLFSVSFSNENSLYINGICVDNNGNDCYATIKPYLFPLSSMTEEQKEEYCLLQEKIIYNGRGVVTDDIMKYLNWCYKNHLDINNLIPKGLAIDCTNLNIY